MIDKISISISENGIFLVDIGGTVTPLHTLLEVVMLIKDNYLKLAYFPAPNSGIANPITLKEIKDRKKNKPTNQDANDSYSQFNLFE